MWLGRLRGDKQISPGAVPEGAASGVPHPFFLMRLLQLYLYTVFLCRFGYIEDVFSPGDANGEKRASAPFMGWHHAMSSIEKGALCSTSLEGAAPKLHLVLNQLVKDQDMKKSNDKTSLSMFRRPAHHRLREIGRPRHGPAALIKNVSARARTSVFAVSAPSLGCDVPALPSSY